MVELIKDAPDPPDVFSVQVSKKHRKTGEFMARNSLLTDLFQISHIKCVRNAFTAGFLIMVLRQLLYDLVHHGKMNWTFELLFLAVGRLQIVLAIWLLMSLFSSLGVFYAIYAWAQTRKQARAHLESYDLLWLGLYLLSIVAFLVFPCWQIVKHQLPCASSALLLGEQLRLLMKIHSFVRESIQKILQEDSTDSSHQRTSLQLRPYLYFLFAPTLLYRDSYPRTKMIQWHIVGKMFGQFFTVLGLVYYLIAYFWMPVFQRFFITSDLTWEMTLRAIYDLMLPGVLIIILAFYGFFHCWLNAFAELLRFADRMFYEDWWNFTSAATFWRSWNIVVHDWLYVYVYKDLSRIFSKEKKHFSTISVVLLSAIFHEYVMVFTLRIVSPVLLGWFALFGMIFRFAFPRAQGAQWNIVLLTFIPICSGLIPYLYVLEASSSSNLSKQTVPEETMLPNGERSKNEL